MEKIELYDLCEDKNISISYNTKKAGRIVKFWIDENVDQENLLPPNMSYDKDSQTIKKNRKINNGLENENKIPKRYNEEDDYLCKCKLIPKTISKKETTMIKLNRKNYPEKHVVQTDNWKNYKKIIEIKDEHGNKYHGSLETSPTPKTDAIIFNIINRKLIKCISIKSGEARLCSGDVFEIRAIFMSVLHMDGNHKDNNILKEKVTNLINKMIKFVHWNGNYKHTLTEYKDARHLQIEYEKDPNNPNKNNDMKWYEEYLKVHDYCKKEWDDLKTNHKEYIRDILFECASGKHKFGENIGRANYLIETENSKSTDIKDYYSLEKRSPELDNYLWKFIPATTSVFAIKSTYRKLSQRFL